MPRTYSFDLSAGQPCLLFTITRVDGTIEHITNASNDVTISATTWAAFPGLLAGVRTSRNDGTPPSLGFTAQLGDGGPLEFEDVDRGKYERARVQIYVTDQANPVAADFEFDGEIRGGVSYDPFGLATFDLMSRFAIPRDIFVPTFTFLCRHSFADPLTCGRGPNAPATFPYIFGGDLADVARNEVIAIGNRRRFRFDTDGTPEDYRNVYLEATVAGTTAGSAPAFSSTVGASVADGGVTWVTKDALARYAQVASVTSHSITLTALPDPRADDPAYPNWYAPLKIMFATGEYKGFLFRGSQWDADTLTFETYLPCPFVAVDDWLEIAPDCDKTIGGGCTVYENWKNHGGFPRQVGAKAQTQQLALT